MIPAYDALKESCQEGAAFPPAVLHYAINRPSGSQWAKAT